MQRAFFLLVAASLVTVAYSASLTPVPAPVIPVAFEENRGQAPAEFSHLMTHYGWGFSCAGVSQPVQSLASIKTRTASLAGAAQSCAASREAPNGSFSHYYGGGGDSTLRVPFVARYDTLTYHQPLPGVDISYSRLGQAGAPGSGFWMRLALDSPARLAGVRLAFSGYYLSTDGKSISSEFGNWPVTAAQSGAVPVPVTVSVDTASLTASFDVPTASAGTPLDIWLEIPLVTTTVSGQFAVDAGGSTFVAAFTYPTARLDTQANLCDQKAFLLCVDTYVAGIRPDGTIRSLTYFGGKYDEVPYTIRLDPGGNVYVAGTTESPDFVNGARVGPAPTAQGSSDIFVLKIHGPTGALINSVTLGGSGSERLYDMGIDGAGDATLTVLSRSADFPAAGKGLFGTQCEANGWAECPWVVKLDPYAGTLLYAFLIPGNHYQDPNAGQPILAVEPGSGAAYLAVSGWIDIPIPPGAVYGTRTDQALTVIAPDGASFQAATYVPPDKVVTAMAVRPDRALWVVGLQTDSTAKPWVATVDAGLSNLNVLPVAIPLPGAVAADSAGRLYLAAPSNPQYPFSLTPTPNAPLSVPCPQAGALLRLDLSGAIDFGTFVPNLGTATLAPGPAGVDLASRDFENHVQVWHVNPDDATPAPPLAGCAFVPAPEGFESISSPIGPGTVVVLLGNDIGPAVPVDLPLDSNGRVATVAGGVRVRIGGAAAPILSGDAQRVTFVVPMAAPYGYADLTVEKDGTAAASLRLTVQQYGLEILAGPYTPPGAEIRNEDGSINSQTNPAHAGAEVRLHLSGAGPTDPPLVDGVLLHPVPEKPQLLSTFLKIGDTFTDVLDFAQAPDLVSGIMELRARIPADVPVGDQAQAVDLSTFFNYAPVFQPAKLWVAK